MSSFKSKFLLAGIEATEGVDPSLVAINAILTQGLSVTPYAGNTVERDYDSPALGAKPKINVNPQTTLQFSVELAGAGTAGTAPGYGALLRACGLLETVNAATDVVYKPRSSGFESISCYFIDNANEKQVTTGVRGNLSLELAAGSLPLLKFDNLIGSYVRPIVATPITPNWAAFKAPVAVTKDNTPLIMLDGGACCLQSLSLNLNNQVSRHNMPGCTGTRITNRAPGGSITIKAPNLADKNWFALVESHLVSNTVELEVSHGTVAGNIIGLLMPKVQLTDITRSDIDGERGYQFNFVALPTNGDDELTLTVK